jgi:outer membrane immunogenic protein
MSTRAFAFVIATVAATAAVRADAPPPRAAAPAPVYCCEAPAVWTGIYRGVHAGAGWSEPSWTVPAGGSFEAVAGQSFHEAARGAIFGGHLGINYQIRHVLIGAEVSYADNRIGYGVNNPLGPPVEFNVGATDLFTVTGRLGFVHSQFLLYGKAGYASASIQADALRVDGTFASADHRLHGWVVGGGLEMRMVSHILFGLEYNYVSLPGERFASLTQGTVPGLAFNADIDDLSAHTFVARLSILFGPQACCSEGLLGKY